MTDTRSAPTAASASMRSSTRSRRAARTPTSPRSARRRSTTCFGRITSSWARRASPADSPER
eukprot:7492196-Heterocapsa_arctica.AAC.1